MKKIIAILAGVLIVLAALFFLFTGFQTRTDVALLDFSVSPDGTELTLHTGIPTSIGYTRRYRDDVGIPNTHHLKFYSTFGGFNSPLGARNAFVLPLQPDDREVYFYRGDGGYDLVLEKNAETGLWQRPSPIANKEFVYEKGGFCTPFFIQFYADGTFYYYEGALSSHLGLGDWTIDSDIVTLTENTMDHPMINRFRIEGDSLVFIEEGSTNFIYIDVADGDRFLLDSQLTLTPIE